MYCLMVQVFYLDRLKRNPVLWGVFPRMQAWSKEDINLAKREDMKVSRDYGRLGVSVKVLFRYSVSVKVLFRYSI